MGTSLTAGLGLEDPEQSYVGVLRAKVDSAGLPLEIVNAGVSGETSAGGLRRADWLLAQPTDVLVLELGANDGLRGLDPEAMHANLQQIVDRARDLHPDVALVVAGMEAPPNLGRDYARRFRQVFPALAHENDGVLIPFLLEGVAGVPNLNQGDGIHPTAEGHRHVAETVWKIIAPVLRRAASKARNPQDEDARLP